MAETKPTLIIYWSRRDFRLLDNPALLAATEYSRRSGIPIAPLFILEEYMAKATAEAQFGYPSRWFVAQAVPQFAALFKKFVVVRGRAARYFCILSQQYNLTIYVNDDVYPDFYTQVEKIKAAGIAIEVVDDALTVAKATASGEGKTYSVFTPFKKKAWAEFVTTRSLETVKVATLMYARDEVLAALPQQIECTTEAIWQEMSKNRTLKVGTGVVDLDEFLPLPILTDWYLNEKSALKKFSRYLASGDLDAYNKNRDSLELDAIKEGKTSKMSLALAWGLVSARTLVKMTQDHFHESFDNIYSNRVSAGALTYLSELVWREFYRYQLFHRPDLLETEFQKKFQGSAILWVNDSAAKERFIAWIKGETGYPVVDAAMKQIAHTGWMHNRSRMVVASILAKNLGVNWRFGQEYFRAALIDLDEASNNGGWQWGASVGADPKPIRIFNPALQAKNYDRSGAYQEKWLGNDILHTEPIPLIEHAAAREEALSRYGLSKVKPRDY